MTVLNFPSSPTDGDTFTENNITYTWVENGGNPGFWSASGEEINLQSVTDNDFATTNNIVVAGNLADRPNTDASDSGIQMLPSGRATFRSAGANNMCVGIVSGNRFWVGPGDAGDANDATFSVANTGTITLANGAGIDFSATPSTGTSELFDDYEEGTWTPNLVGAVVAGTITTSNLSARYTKIGNQVTCWAAFGISAASGANGSLSITGLPFTYPANTFITGSVRWNSIAYNGSSSASPNDVVVLQGSGGSANFVQIAYSSDGAGASTTVLASGQITTSTFIQFCLTYTV